VEVSLEWLNEFVDLPPLDELVAKLAKAGIEVERVYDPAAKVQGVVVGLIEASVAHPAADKLHVCTVFDGSTRHEVVCGAANCGVGMRVPFARVGATLPGVTITARKLRGVESQGMLCSRVELGLAEKSDGLWELPETFELGADVLKQAKIAPTLTLSITPNRPDLLSHVGVARELAAAFGKKTKPPVWRVTEKGPEAGSLGRVVVDEPMGCRRYVARVVRNIKVGPSPAWLRSRLEQAGQRSVNNVVDATNYVLFELGQPLHAFDLALIASEAGMPTVHVRRAKAKEKMKTLDGKELELDVDDLVIADANGPVALAGVMGGAESEVSDVTTQVLLESAHFDPARVRRAAKRYGMHTESSHRFERGADPGILQKAVDRCAQLLTEIAGGEVAKGLLEVTQKSEPSRDISLRLDRIGRILGIDLPAEEVAQLLEPLGIRCVARNESSLRFAPPSFRPDLAREIDLIEELARRVGYDQIPERLPNTGSAYVPALPIDDTRERARAALLAAGCSEVITFGFGSPTEQQAAAPDKGEPVRILNALGEELSAMRMSLLPGLLKVLATNQRRGAKHVRLFEVGTVFHKRTADPSEDERERDLPHEELRAGILLFGGRHQGRWYEAGETVDFSDVAGVTDSLIDAFSPATALGRAPSTSSVLNPHCSATLQLDGKAVGYLGMVHPQLLARFDVTGPVYVGEVTLAALTAARRVLRYAPLPRFPGTRRDVAVIAERGVPAETLRAFLAEHAGGKLGSSVVEEVRLFDVYSGKPVPETHVSLAFAIEYRSSDRTLTDAEVGEAFLAVQDALKQKFRVEVRSAS